MVTGLTLRSDLNHRAARVLSKSWTEAAQHPGRVPVEMVVGKESMWIKLENIEGPILDPADMTAPPYDAMTPEERTEASLQMLEPPKSAPATRALRPNEPVNLFQDIYESIEAPAPAPTPAPAPAPEAPSGAAGQLSGSIGKISIPGRESSRGARSGGGGNPKPNLTLTFTRPPSS